eukprot:2745966-Rhodomonas_salina.2
MCAMAHFEASLLSLAASARLRCSPAGVSWRDVSAVEPSCSGFLRPGIRWIALPTTCDQTGTNLSCRQSEYNAIDRVCQGGREAERDRGREKESRSSSKGTGCERKRVGVGWKEKEKVRK